MSDIAEGLGVAIEGSITAKAVEPHDGAATSAPTGETECANCGAPLTGPYCNQCGQKAHIHRTLPAIGHDLIHGVLHLDGKLAHTLPLLAFKPGRLTRRYIEGERAKFVSPMAMFLFSVFAMFAVFQMVGLSVPTSFGENFSPRTAVAEMSESMIDARIVEINRQIEEIDASGSSNDTLRTELQDEFNDLKEMRTQVDSAAAEAMPETDLSWDDVDMVITGNEAFDKGILKKWRENPGLMLYKLQANGYKFGWLLIPISLPFMMLLFLWRRRHKAYDHTVFITYSLSFMSLFFIALSLAVAVGVAAGGVFAALVIVAPFHVYKHLRYTYGLSRFSAIWRFFALFFFITIILGLFLNSLLLLGAF